MAQSLRGTANTIVVEGYASASDKDKNAASLDRANRMREQLVRNGVDPNKVVAVGKGEQQGRASGARIVEEPSAPIERAAPVAAAVAAPPAGKSDSK